MARLRAAQPLVNEEETKIVDDVFVCGQDNCRALRFKYRSSQCLSIESSNVTISKNFHLKKNVYIRGELRFNTIY